MQYSKTSVRCCSVKGSRCVKTGKDAILTDYKSNTFLSVIFILIQFVPCSGKADYVQNWFHLGLARYSFNRVFWTSDMFLYFGMKLTITLVTFVSCISYRYYGNLRYYTSTSVFHLILVDTYFDIALQHCYLIQRMTSDIIQAPSPQHPPLFPNKCFNTVYIPVLRKDLCY